MTTLGFFLFGVLQILNHVRSSLLVPSCGPAKPWHLLLPARLSSQKSWPPVTSIKHPPPKKKLKVNQPNSLCFRFPHILHFKLHFTIENAFVLSDGFERGFSRNFWRVCRRSLLIARLDVAINLSLSVAILENTWATEEFPMKIPILVGCLLVGPIPSSGTTSIRLQTRA